MTFILTDKDTCEEMQAALANPNVALFYGPVERVFGIPFIQPGDVPREVMAKPLAEGVLPYGGEGFCPWTGEALPIHCYDWKHYAYSEGLIEESDYDTISPLDLPEEYHSEQWWMNRAVPRDVEYRWPEPPLTKIRPPDGQTDWWELEPFVAAGAEWTPFQDPDCPGQSRWSDIPAHHCESCWPLWFWAGGMYAYLPHTREFGIRIIDMDKPVCHQPIEIVPVNYCHRCGHKLPQPLRPEWEKRMRAKGLDPSIPRNPFSVALPDGLDGEKWWRVAQDREPDWAYEYVPPFVPSEVVDEEPDAGDF
ncbi:hypothetical protein V5T82_11645 [Magnetovibrio sp. PR-2]|uniref:hypothetical protein n=1 Tax=Magnetovibrio sp. PR-2 TaxID=3120356 RepID=UPI002FCE363E